MYDDDNDPPVNPIKATLETAQSEIAARLILTLQTLLSAVLSHMIAHFCHINKQDVIVHTDRRR
jgi:hypothetical protein